MYTPPCVTMLQRMATAHHLPPGTEIACSTLVTNHLLGTVKNGGIVKNSCQSLGVKERLHINKYTLCIHPVSTCHCTKLPNSGTVSKVTWKHFSEMGWSAHQCFCVRLHILSSVQFKMVSMHSEKPMCAPPHPSELSPSIAFQTVPLSWMEVWCAENVGKKHLPQNPYVAISSGHF